MAEATGQNNSARSMASSSIPTPVETISIPGYAPSTTSIAFDPLKYRVKYAKINLDDIGGRSELEIIETRGLAGVEVIVLNKAAFSFMDQYHMIVTYLELISATPQS